MQKHIDDMLNGEHIVLVVPSRRSVITALWGKNLPAQVIVNVTQMKLSDPVSGGWIQLFLPAASSETLRGILVDVRFSEGAEYLVSSEF